LLWPGVVAVCAFVWLAWLRVHSFWTGSKWPNDQMAKWLFIIVITNAAVIIICSLSAPRQHPLCSNAMHL